MAFGLFAFASIYLDNLGFKYFQKRIDKEFNEKEEYSVQNLKFIVEKYEITLLNGKVIKGYVPPEKGGELEAPQPLQDIFQPPLIRE